jgi:2-polyprenyl-6-methoxyphenol hydroxylase-like FAD-dependent oxidoreductase
MQMVGETCKTVPVVTPTVEFGTNVMYPKVAPQYITEDYLQENGDYIPGAANIEWGKRLVAIEQSDNEVVATVETEKGVEIIKGSFVVGCDGAHSVCRKAIGAEFKGESLPAVYMLGDVTVSFKAPAPVSHAALRFSNKDEFQMWIPLEEQKRRVDGTISCRYRISGPAPQRFLDANDDDKTTTHGFLKRPPPTLQDIASWSDEFLCSTPFKGCTIESLIWSSFYRVSNRISSKYQEGRIFIAGDAAHIHSPKGGLGMNTGLQDAIGLGWRLAQTLSRGLPPGHPMLLGYNRERQVVGEELVAEKAKTVKPGESPAMLALKFDSQLFIKYDPVKGSGEALSELIAPGVRLPVPLAGFLRQHEHRTEYYKILSADVVADVPPLKFPVEVIHVERGLLPAGFVLLVRPDQHIEFIGKMKDLLSFMSRL